MKDFVKITKETWRFYLTVFLILFLFVICNAIYCCNENMVLKYEEGMNIPDMGTVFTDIISDKTDMMLDLLGIPMVVITIITVLVIRRFVFMDLRTKEFESFLPVRNKSIVMHTYWFSFGITFVLNAALTVILIIGQTDYNKKLLQAAKSMGTGNIAQDYVTAPNRELLWNCVCYFIFTVFLLNIIYLGMLLCKNEIAGMLISVFFWRVMVEGVEFLIYRDYTEYFGLWEYLGGSEQDAEKVGRVLETIEEAIDPKMFWNYNMGSAENGNAIFITAAVALVSFFLIVLLSGRRELSKGKIFYFKWTDALFAVFGAVTVWVKLHYYLEMPHTMIGFVVGVILWFLIKPSNKGRLTLWEVK